MPRYSAALSQSGAGFHSREPNRSRSSSTFWWGSRDIVCLDKKLGTSDDEVVARGARELLNSAAVSVSLAVLPRDELQFVGEVVINPTFGRLLCDQLSSLVEANLKLVRPHGWALRNGNRQKCCNKQNLHLINMTVYV